VDIKCIDNKPSKNSYPDITIGNVYFVLGIEGDYFRIFGDLGIALLYHKSRFEVINPDLEPEWIKTIDKNIGEIYYPPEFINGQIFKDYFSGNIIARNVIHHFAYKLQERRIAKIYDADLVKKFHTPFTEEEIKKVHSAIKKFKKAQRKLLAQ